VRPCASEHSPSHKHAADSRGPSRQGQQAGSESEAHPPGLMQAQDQSGHEDTWHPRAQEPHSNHTDAANRARATDRQPQVTSQPRRGQPVDQRRLDQHAPLKAGLRVQVIPRNSGDRLSRISMTTPRRT
jgi:hypothetical protein